MEVIQVGVVLVVSGHGGSCPDGSYLGGSYPGGSCLSGEWSWWELSSNLFQKFSWNLVDTCRCKEYTHFKQKEYKCAHSVVILRRYANCPSAQVLFC